MSEYEVVIVKAAVITVMATSPKTARLIAQNKLDGYHGYSEYANDGWEVEREIEPEVKK